MKKITILIVCMLWTISSGAQVTIYRDGIATDTLPSLLSLSGRVKARDSIVLSPGVYSFPGAWAAFDTDVVLCGIRTPTDSTVLDNGLIQAYRNANITIRDMIIRNYDFEGSTIMGEAGTIIKITGNSRLHHNQGKPDGKSPAPSISYPGVIYSKGIVYIEGNTMIDSNTGIAQGAIYAERGAFVSGNVVIRGNVAQEADGGAIACLGPCNISGNVIIEGNRSARLGGGIFVKGPLQISGNVKFLNNYADAGGAIYASGYRNTFSIKDSVIFSGNNSRSGTAIVNENGSRLSIDGVQFINNGAGDTAHKTIPTIVVNYTDSLFIFNSRIFNPNLYGVRQVEVYSATPVIMNSDTCWWGNSDTSGLIVLQAGSTLNLNSWVVANWTVNYGKPISSVSAFPVTASFTLQDSSAIAPGLFWMLSGTFEASSGSFSSITSSMTPANIISANYTAGTTTIPVTIRAFVDADTFTTTETIVGTTINEIGNSQKFEIYPNPSNGDIFIRRQNETIDDIQVGLFDMGGRQITRTALRFNNNIAIVAAHLIPGTYVLTITSKRKDEMIAVYNISVNR